MLIYIYYFFYSGVCETEVGQMELQLGDAARTSLVGVADHVAHHFRFGVGRFHFGNSSQFYVHASRGESTQQLI